MMAMALPALRQELRLLPAAANRDGSPAWTVQDPVNNRFFRIGWLDFELLLRWTTASAEEVVACVNASTTLNVDLDDVKGLLHFLEQHQLVQANSQQASDGLLRRAELLKKPWYVQLVQHYLFFRIPLVRPQFALQKILPWLAWIFSPQAAVAIAIVGLLGVFLAARQWDVFIHTFIDQLSWSGLACYFAALVFAKAAHEFGHALTATHYGVRVGHMGVALVVMFPMLYTDTSESWKLSDSRQRLAIASAGIAAELALASAATLAWALAPEGSVKSALFFLATISWLLTLTINASPFMRFDGYFILSDILDLPNLHERSTRLAQTWLRRHFLGLSDQWPEQLPGRGNSWLIAFALTTWLYRLVAFFGIALVVYYFFFKALGILLFLVELVVFIGRPVGAEVSVWWRRRREIKPNRKWLGGLLFASFVVLGLLPWQTAVRSPGLAYAARSQVIHAPLAGRLLSMAKNGEVTQGQTLFALESPELELAVSRADQLALARGLELVGLAGLPDGEARRTAVTLQQEQFMAEANLYDKEQQRLRVPAPFSGVLRDLDTQLAPGVWVQPKQALAVLIQPKHWVVDAYVAESDIGRVRSGNAARIQIRGVWPYFRTGRVTEVDTTRVMALPYAIVDAQAGGPVATLPNTGNSSTARVPRDAIYRVKIELDAPPVAEQMAVVGVSIEAEPRAWLPWLLQTVAAIVVRESGF